MAMGNERMKYAKTILCEGLLCIGLSSTSRLTAMNILQAQLAEIAGGTISSDDVHEVLLQAAREKVH